MANEALLIERLDDPSVMWFTATIAGIKKGDLLVLGRDSGYADRVADIHTGNLSQNNTNNPDTSLVFLGVAEHDKPASDAAGTRVAIRTRGIFRMIADAGNINIGDYVALSGTRNRVSKIGIGSMSIHRLRDIVGIAISNPTDVGGTVDVILKGGF